MFSDQRRLLVPDFNLKIGKKKRIIYYERGCNGKHPNTAYIFLRFKFM